MFWARRQNVSSDETDIWNILVSADTRSPDKPIRTRRSVEAKVRSPTVDNVVTGTTRASVSKDLSSDDYSVMGLRHADINRPCTVATSASFDGCWRPQVSCCSISQSCGAAIFVNQLNCFFFLSNCFLCRNFTDSRKSWKRELGFNARSQTTRDRPLNDDASENFLSPVHHNTL